MITVQQPITGTESQGQLSSPYQALVQFYRAFNTCDLHLMAENWSREEGIAMDNPLGGIRRGWPEIRSVYESIFTSSAEVYVEFYDYTLHETTEIFYAVGRERGYFRLKGDEIALAIRTSRIFRKEDGLWRQVHHHGSIEDPQLLDRYQKGVRGG